jgi:hypothetical protein
VQPEQASRTDVGVCSCIAQGCRVIWTAIVVVVIVATTIVAIVTDTPTPLEDDEATWP